MYYIRLYSQYEGHKMDFDIIDILGIIPEFTKRFDWFLKFGYGDDIVLESGEMPYDLLDQLSAIELDDKEYTLCGERLMELSQEIYQSINFILIAIPKGYFPSHYDVSLVDHGEINNRIQLSIGVTEIRAVDSSYFEVVTKDENVFESFRKSFCKYKVILN